MFETITVGFLLFFTVWRAQRLFQVKEVAKMRKSKQRAERENAQQLRLDREMYFRGKASKTRIISSKEVKLSEEKKKKKTL